MKNLLVVLLPLLLFNLLFTSLGISQNLTEVKFTKREAKEGVIKKYSYQNRYDGSVKLLLYGSKRYSYQIKSITGALNSEGRWSVKDRCLYLSSTITKNSVPVKFKYFIKNDKIRMTPFLIPVNLKNNEFPDSRIYINNDSTYCFPYFDTCIGYYDKMRRIKIDFGGGYKTKWINIKSINENKLLVVAQTEFILSSYLIFNKRKYKISGPKLKLIE